MNSDKRVLSFALNPLTNKIEFVAIPETVLQRNIQTHRFRNSSNRQHATIPLSRRQSQRRVRLAGQSTEEQSAKKQKRNVQKVDLNDLLTSLVLSSTESEATCFQSELNGVMALASTTGIQLLVMMDYTQKLSYIRSKRKQMSSLCDKITEEISRVTKLVLQQQQTYCNMLCRQYLPEHCQ